MPVAVRNRVGVPLHASCTAGSPVVPRGVAALRPCRRGSPSRSLVGMRSTAGMDWLGGWRAGRGRRAARHGPQRGAAERRSSCSHRSRYSAAGHAASGHGRSLGRGEHRGDQPWDPGSWSSSTWTGSGPTSRSPTTCVDCGKPRARSSANWSPTAADRSPQVPRRHAARHNHRGSRHRRRYDQIQPPTAASNDQIQAGDLSAAPQSRAWTADNTGLPRQQRPCRLWVVAVASGSQGADGHRRSRSVTKHQTSPGRAPSIGDTRWQLSGRALFKRIDRSVHRNGCHLAGAVARHRIPVRASARSASSQGCGVSSASG